jgi:hypothetical protein
MLVLLGLWLRVRRVGWLLCRSLRVLLREYFSSFGFGLPPEEMLILFCLAADCIGVDCGDSSVVVLALGRV